MSRQSPKVEFITERKRLAAGREQTVDVLIRITPPEADGNGDRRPTLNLSLVLDRSGSMEGEKIERAREAARYCVDQLLPTDRVSVVTFDDRVDALIPSQPAENKSHLKRLIDTVTARNSTALHEAWLRGGMEVSGHLRDDAINRVLLITDGLANVGLTDPDEIVSQAGGLHSRGVSTSTIGIGADFNEDLLMRMAEAAGGNAWHVQEPEDMQRVFAVELEGLVAQVAHTVSLGLVLSDGVQLLDVLNDFELTETGRYKLPNLQAGAPLDVVARLRVPAGAAGARRHLLDLRLGYNPQESRQREVVRHRFEVKLAEESAVAALPVNHDVVKAAQLLTNARARREAVSRMDAGRYEEARVLLRETRAGTVAACAAFADTAEVQAELADLDELEAGLVSRGEDSMNRKRLAYAAYQRRQSKGSR